MADFVGGEFWYDARYQGDALQMPRQGMMFLNGGEAALRLICDYLIARGVREILVPAYICSTIADAFDRYGLAYTFYPIRDDFRLDLEHLRQIAPAFRVLYLINYFGYGYTAEEVAVFNQLKQQGMLIIEDGAQGGYRREKVGHIRFNSLRKFVPYDGSFFYTDRDMSASLAKYVGLPNRRLPVIREYRRTFARLLADGAESFDVLNALFDQSEIYYYADLTVLGDPVEQRALEHLDWTAMEATRKANHQHLCERLSDIPEIEIIFPKVSPDGPPLGFPIYVKNGQRDALLGFLRDRQVYPIVHWDILHDPRINKTPLSAAMSMKIMTLILDQRFDLDDMDYQAGVVKTFFRG